ncbi:transcriptional attenuator, LytR family [Alkalithermobacter thermoalcaliphilus JW-YL-7 = DSM 7308]|uniref:Cell envelope-related transcriptional attenuator n=1 Tax=Alkalithermobacter thermoalcaliphilus JW-YL-7 = DSM 7308 TaxID=1121328 RepID=A0A150FTT2_CLOPD|nr:cell envelope-related transcriptional attenuator [[Clostridium] paradoxum JW-YL-7 = DSM 7308]SHK69788.1 transcriptional attenuator, LytR family [[Clostridium] paradoxum JW-YL-7 = DSM 7308]
MKRVGLIFLILITVLGIYTYVLFTKEGTIDEEVTLDKPNKISQEDTRVNVLLLGVDARDVRNINRSRTDTIMILSFDPKTNDTSILSIPRDSRVLINGRYDKINHAHAYGGVNLAVETVKNLLDIPIHHYIRVNFEAVEKIVDTIGGVSVYIPSDMKEGSRVVFSKGEHLLDGKKALEFVRFRKGYTDQDIGRTRAQQQFMQALFKKMASPSSILNAPKYLDVFNNYVDTSMSKKDIMSLGLRLKDADPNKMKNATLPGRPAYINNISYYILDEDGVKALISEFYK